MSDALPREDLIIGPHGRLPLWGAAYSILSFMVLHVTTSVIATTPPPPNMPRLA